MKNNGIEIKIGRSYIFQRTAGMIVKIGIIDLTEKTILYHREDYAKPEARMLINQFNKRWTCIEDLNVTFNNNLKKIDVTFKNNLKKSDKS